MTHEQRLHEINTLEWDDLLVKDEPFKPAMPKGGNKEKVLNEAWVDYQFYFY